MSLHTILSLLVSCSSSSAGVLKPNVNFNKTPPRSAKKDYSSSKPDRHFYDKPIYKSHIIWYYLSQAKWKHRAITWPCAHLYPPFMNPRNEALKKHAVLPRILRCSGSAAGGLPFLAQSATTNSGTAGIQTGLFMAGKNQLVKRAAEATLDSLDLEQRPDVCSLMEVQWQALIQMYLLSAP